MQNVILQINTILTTTTTSILQIIYEYNPPKIFSNFKYYFLSGISPNTLQAGYIIVPMLSFGGDLVQPWPSSDVLETLFTLQHQYHLLSAPPLDQIDESMTMPWHGMASPCPLSPPSPQ
jgi:hypothetical protein